MESTERQKQNTSVSEYTKYVRKNLKGERQEETWYIRRENNDENVIVRSACALVNGEDKYYVSYHMILKSDCVSFAIETHKGFKVMYQFDVKNSQSVAEMHSAIKKNNIPEDARTSCNRTRTEEVIDDRINIPISVVYKLDGEFNYFSSKYPNQILDTMNNSNVAVFQGLECGPR